MSRTKGHNVRRYDGHKLWLAEKAIRKAIRQTRDDSNDTQDFDLTDLEQK